MSVKYRTHPGVTLEQAAGRFFLVAFGDAGKELPYLREINETGAYYWELLSAGLDENGVLKEAEEAYGMPRVVLEKGLQAYICDLKTNGYLLEDG